MFFSSTGFVTNIKPKKKQNKNDVFFAFFQKSKKGPVADGFTGEDLFVSSIGSENVKKDPTWPSKPALGGPFATRTVFQFGFFSYTSNFASSIWFNYLISSIFVFYIYINKYIYIYHTSISNKYIYIYRHTHTHMQKHTSGAARRGLPIQRRPSSQSSRDLWRWVLSAAGRGFCWDINVIYLI